MRLSTSNLYLVDRAFTDKQTQQLLNSKNAMSAFVWDSRGVQRLPDSYYLSVYSETAAFLGAVHLEQDPFSSLVSIHPMLLERDREVFTEVTEAAILWCINTGKYPSSQVLDTPEYEYMHKFLAELGMVVYINNGWKVYKLPRNWKPKSFSIYKMEFA